jgi:hypothetical protein
LASALTISSALVAAPSDPLSRIELVETLAPLIPIEKQMDGDRTGQYTDLASITDPQRLILNGYLAQSKTKSGTSASLFSPTMGATRAQAAVMIHRMVSAANPKWTSAITESTPVLDANTVAWAKASIVDLVNAGVIEPVGPGYVFPNRSVSLETATQWVASASVFIPKPAPIAVVQAVPTESIQVVTDADDAPRTVMPVSKPKPDPIQTPRPGTPRWEVRAYTSLAFSSNAPHKSIETQPYIRENEAADNENPVTTLYTERFSEPVDTHRHTFGLEVIRQWRQSPVWFTAGYGQSVIKESNSSQTIQIPAVVLIEESSDFKEHYSDATNDGTLLENRTIPAASNIKQTHSLNLGFRRTLYSANFNQARIDIYAGSGLSLSTASIRGKKITLPKQTLKSFPNTGSVGDDHPAEKRVSHSSTDEFYYTHNQVSIYGELGVVATQLPFTIGLQIRGQENPGELSVDTDGNKVLIKERTWAATVFSGIKF